MLIQLAVSLGEVVQTRAFGGTARFTLPGMEARRKRGQDKILAGREEAKYEPGRTAGDKAEERFDKEGESEKEPGTTASDEVEEKSGLYLAEWRAGLEEQLRNNRPITRSRLTIC